MSRPNLDEQILVDTSDEDSLCDAQSIIDSNFSLTSTTRDYLYENGRRYHAYRLGHYPMPNDEEEQDRLAFMHHLFKLLVGGDLYRAPILNDGPPKRILDVGTGTGIWALEMADDFPDAEITFTPAEAFDYIHARSLGGGIGDWNRFLRQAYRHTKPGGWVEIQEYETWIRSDDGTIQRAPMLLDWQQKIDAASTQFGRPMNVASSLAGWMQEVGFVNVTDDSYKCPVGSWPKSPRLKEIGRVGKITLYEAVEPYTLALFTRVLGWSGEDAQEYVNKVRADLLRPDIHVYVVYHYVYGRRPANS
ncbi:hypothetical protein CNMCM6069_001044 [Aspergillus lentulus]|nr:hypothetical protein CNMCM6069_001044 [Aspergillus lentulus]